MRPPLKEVAELCERLRNHSADALVISRQSVDMDAAAGVIVRQHEDIDRLEERVRVLEEALRRAETFASMTLSILSAGGHTDMLADVVRHRTEIRTALNTTGDPK